jgi:hypothetical protein
MRKIARASSTYAAISLIALAASAQANDRARDGATVKVAQMSATADQSARSDEGASQVQCGRAVGTTCAQPRLRCLTCGLLRARNEAEER